eukprot:538501_1
MINRTHNTHKLLIIFNYILIQAGYSQKYVYNSNQKTWYQAELFCLSVYNTHLASIHSNSDNVEAHNMCVSGQSGQSGGCHIGFNDKVTEGLFAWSDGSSVDFTYWEPGEPNNWKDQDCAEVLYSTGKWNDFHCDAVANPFLCNAPTSSPTPSPTPAPTAAPTSLPTENPSPAPTVFPSTAPSYSPSNTPTIPPSVAPSYSPSSSPSNAPSQSPTACIDYNNSQLHYISNDGEDDIRPINISHEINHLFENSLLIDSVIYYNTKPNESNPVPYYNALITCVNDFENEICFIECIGTLSCFAGDIIPKSNNIDTLLIKCNVKDSCK